MKAINSARASKPESPLPWTLDDDGALWAANGECVGDFMLAGDAAHILAAVKALPALLAEVDKLKAKLEASSGPQSRR